jgi:predicted tellurium resistance membrane protein TerC
MSSRTLAPSAPNKILWLLALVVGILGIIGTITPLEGITAYANTLIMVAFILLAIGTSLRGI